MEKNKFIGFRTDDDILEFIKEEAKKSNKTMSDWIRNGIEIKKQKKNE